MSDQWFSVTITGITLSDKQFGKLPDFEFWNGDPWDEYRGWQKPDGTMTEGCYSTTGHGHSQHPDIIANWARKFTEKHPDATVDVVEEYYDSDVGKSSDVYRGGELVELESTVEGMVPRNLEELLTAAGAALADYHSPDPVWSITSWRAYKAPAVVGALENLMKGLKRQ